MARNGVLDRFRSSLRFAMLLVSRTARSRPLALRRFLLVLAVAAGLAPGAHAEGLFRALTPRDRAEPMILSETGAPIPRGSMSHPAALIASGTVPAYLAYPLMGGEHLPPGVPTLASGQTPGQQGVGPMDLTQSDVLALNADIQASRFAIVNAPGQSFAVAFLPRYSRALAHATPPPASTSSASASTGSTNPLAALGLPTSINQWTIQGIPGSQISRWVNTGTNELAHLSSLGLDGVTRTLHLAGIKVTPTPDGLHLAPQFLVPSSSSSGATAGAPLPVPAPEPSTWLVFALVLGGAAALRPTHRTAPPA